ncbi:MAG: MBL fold metallo-hydrolase [Alphaproteobacteria bacterium]|nr:MBL fold metallo-hydrolase [Alphaproteobacteria bacterium]
MNSRKTAFALGLCAGLLGAGTAQAQPSAPYPVVQGKNYKFQKIADGVYYALPEANGTEFPFGSNPFFGANLVVIVNKDDVVIVDSGTSPAAARAFVADIKLLTDKPVRYVVNTHWHYDHTDGNSIFGPEVQIIAHDYVRQAIEKFDILHNEPFRSSTRNAPQAMIDRFREQLAAEKDPRQRVVLQKKLADTEAAARAFVQDIKEIKPTPPNVTYTDRLVLYRGGREIDLLFLGRGHTGGDTVVFLPRERIVCTGDLMESRIAFMGSAFFDEWLKTLDALKRLDFTVDLPGHGAPFTDKGLITAFQSYLSDVLAQVAKLRAQGVLADEAARRVDLTAHAKDFPDIESVGAEVRGIRRVYAWMDERNKK